MDQAIEQWIKEHPILSPSNDTPAKLKLTYTIYGHMLLLPQNAFKTPAWQNLNPQTTPEDFRNLYALIAKHLKITHIAINKPIPALQPSSTTDENILRAPQNFTPIHGDFGPTSCSSPPSRRDFEAAFWTTAKQNGILQTWAPRWTMFSRGNVSEKARLLTLDSVREAAEQGSAAVDLFAGIGYFAFSYLKAGVGTVLCWDLNPWSLEGLRRGAEGNGWAFQVGGREALGEDEVRLLVFSESNKFASERVRRLRHCLQPIRHVNCGMLPTSRGSWQTALDVLDPELGGWLHIHENFAVEGIEEKSEEVRATLQNMLDDDARGMKLEYIHQLKSYAPGVMHCVLDIYIPPPCIPS